MTTSVLMMIIFIPIGIVLLAALFIYLFGNVYNGLVKRRERINHSWYELAKSLKRSYDLIPPLLQETKMDDLIRSNLAEIYKRYTEMDMATVSPKEAASLDAIYQQELDKLTSQGAKSEALDFVIESRRTARFSIPLYNHNVHDYTKFKNMLVNRRLSKLWGFKDGVEFVPPEGENNSTIDFRLDGFIKK